MQRVNILIGQVIAANTQATTIPFQYNTQGQAQQKHYWKDVCFRLVWNSLGFCVPNVTVRLRYIA